MLAYRLRSLAMPPVIEVIGEDHAQGHVLGVTADSVVERLFLWVHWGASVAFQLEADIFKPAANAPKRGYPNAFESEDFLWSQLK